MNRREFTVAGLSGAAAMAGGARAAAVRFPKGFQWGVATAAHQIEGNNVNSDLWLLEHLKPTPFVEPSGDACDSYHRFGEDIGLVAKLGLSTYRYSVEWARIEPAPGAYSQAELDHYRRMAEACRKAGVRPLVTYHHFSAPRWLSALGGWADPATPDRFAVYSDRVTRAMGDLIDGVCTINEPNGVLESWSLAGDRLNPKMAAFAAQAGRAVDSGVFAGWGMGDMIKSRDNLIAAHQKGRAAIKAVRPNLPVGMTLALTDLSAGPGGDTLYRHVYDTSRGPFYEAARGDEFIGVQSYSRTRVGPTGPLAATERVLPMGYEYWPQALEACVREAARETGCPVLVTENGIGTQDDNERIAFIDAALAGLRRCIQDDVDVRGYIHWSLLDNFEWLQGYRPKFGIVAVDRRTFVRTLKPSAAHLSKIARSNGQILA